MSLPPDVEKQELSKDSGGSIRECSDDDAQATQPEHPLSAEPHQESTGPQNPGTAPGPNASGNARHARPMPKTTFGLPKQTTVDPPYDPIAATYDYSKKYEPDPMFHEADEHARVWHVYNDEAAIFDADMIEEASDSLDILLVFAGLFSGVLTTFLAQTSQSLGQDNSGLTVALLQEMVNLQRAQAKGISLETIPQAESSGPSSSDKLINGLWFASLTLSLSSALIAVLVKQWLRYYRSRTTGSSRDCALIRQSRHDGFKKWQVQPIIGVLPTILHVALFLFLIGLVLFLTRLDKVISIVIGTMAFLLLGTYVVAIVLPVILVHCPYRTPVGDLIHRLFRNGTALKVSERHSALWRLDSAYTALEWLVRGTSNRSVSPIVAESVTAVWESDYTLSQSPTTMETKKLEDLAFYSFYTLHHQLPLSSPRQIPELENRDWTQFNPEESKKLQQKLLYFSVLHTTSEEDSLKDIEITALGSDPALGLLALSIGLRVRFKGDRENDQADNTMSVASKKPFTWLLNHHCKLTMPKLHPAVWKKLQESERWNVEEITRENMSADLRSLIRESWDLRLAANIARLHQPMSLASFFNEQRILHTVIDHLFGDDWEVSEVEQWLRGPVDGNERVSPESQVIHSSL